MLESIGVTGNNAAVQKIEKNGLVAYLRAIKLVRAAYKRI